MTAELLESHASRGRRRPKHGNGEQAMASWLKLNGWRTVGWEPDTLDLPNGRALAPDTKLVSGIYLELTKADFYLSEGQLPTKTRRKNRQAHSGKIYITPAEVIERKRRKIREAEGIHGIVVILIPWILQQRLISGQLNLAWLIALRLASIESFDSYIDACLPQVG